MTPSHHLLTAVNTGDEISPLGIIGRQRSTPGQPRLNAP
jgi:hypothetical protein